MKEGIHPNYVECDVRCACGHTFKTRSTKSVIAVDVCSHCHPFFTGQQKLMDTAGRVERFAKRFATTEGKTIQRVVKGKAAKPVAKSAKKLGILSTAPRKVKKAPEKAAKKDKK